MKCTDRRVQRRRRRRSAPRERGVASVLSMMFLIIFGSLATAMAIASRGNIRTAATHLHVMRAMGAAETGLAIGRKRLEEAASRFVVSHSNVDSAFGGQVWSGGITTGSVDVQPPPSGHAEASTPSGIAQALANAHAADQNVVAEAGPEAPTIGSALPDVDSAVYATSDWLYTPAVGLEQVVSGGDTPPVCYSVIYAPLANGTDVRVIVTGFDFSYQRHGVPITRTIMQDFRMVKRVNQAIVSPSRIMIGKDVLISGDLGCRYTDVTRPNGNPLLMRSDFRGLSDPLNAKLADLYAALEASDTDGDDRLRVNHPTEGEGIPADADYDGDGSPDGAFEDATGDGYLDEFDLFIREYDSNGDGKVALSDALRAGTQNESLSAEFVGSGGEEIDDDLALLIDTNSPDRNRNGIYGFVDADGDGRWDAGEVMLDYDSTNDTNRDQVLGYRDGVIDKKDRYAKVGGRLIFKTTSGAWTAAQGAYSTKLEGPVRAGKGNRPLTFNASDTQLPLITASSFSGSGGALQGAANGSSFAQQVADQLGVSTGQLATYVETEPSSSTEARFERVDPDANLDGKPDNWQTASWEAMPFNSPSPADHYYRPVYQNMVFRDVQVPAGTNARFVNCTFVGVTFVRTATANNHVLWGEYGKLTIDPANGRPGPAFIRSIYGDGAGETFYPTMLPATAVPPNQMILMAATPMDKADVPSNLVASTQGYNLLPDPLVIAGLRVTDTKLHSNNIRFHDCLMVGSIVSDTPSTYTHVRNKLQFTGSTRFVNEHPTSPEDPQLNPESDDEEEIAKSSLMAPNYSVDIGSFNSPSEQDIRLRGAVIAGVLDIRGNAQLDGALLLTFNPVYGQAPLVDAAGNAVGNPAGYNTTIGYFGPEDGDEESIDPNDLPVVGGQRIVGWDTDGDGIADVGHDQAQPPGSTAVPFHGYGGIHLRFDPNMTMPDGILLPMQVKALSDTYREGRP